MVLVCLNDHQKFWLVLLLSHHYHQTLWRCTTHASVFPPGHLTEFSPSSSRTAACSGFWTNIVKDHKCSHKIVYNITCPNNSRIIHSLGVLRLKGSIYNVHSLIPFIHFLSPLPQHNGYHLVPTRLSLL